MEEKMKKKVNILEQMDEPSHEEYAKVLDKFVKDAVKSAFEDAKQKVLAEEERGKEEIDGK